MNKSKFIFVLITLSSVASCQLANTAKGLADRGGSGAFSCGQIEAAFSAYQADRTSVDAYLELAQLTGLSTSNVTTQTVDSYYGTARERANLALIVQGCPPL